MDFISDTGASVIIIVACIIGLIAAFYFLWDVSKISLDPLDRSNPMKTPVNETSKEALDKVYTVTHAIAEGAQSFLAAEYRVLSFFVIGFAALILVLVSIPESDWTFGVFSAIAYILGAATSIVSGYIGMRTAVFANGRTAVSAQRGWDTAFACAYKAGCVLGFALPALGVIVCFFLIILFKLKYPADSDQYSKLWEAIAGYGLGGSTVALFGRVGGGIYTKAADVGSDLVGKVEAGIPEDDPRNPGVIADNVGDNVGDIAGMGADLFGSFAESTCAALVIASQSSKLDLLQHWPSMMFPLLISSTGIIVSFLTTFVATHISPVRSEAQIEPTLKRQLLISAVLETPVIYVLTQSCLPPTFAVSNLTAVRSTDIFFCVASGLWAGLIIGYITEYYTSHQYTPVREVAESCRTGAATNIIYGLALGYKSAIIPVFALSVTIFVCFYLAGLYGIAVGALGILSTLSIALTIDAYGPISDNAGGIAEMAGLGPETRERTDALDAAGNTTAAIGKGFAIGSAALVSLALFGAFMTRVSESQGPQGSIPVNILSPYEFVGLLIGSMLPYWFTAMTMKSVGKAAMAMVEEIREQFRDGLIMQGRKEPDYKRCVEISTIAALREMILPGVLVLGAPIVTGFLIGHRTLSGLLAGAIVSGVQIAISSSNTGGGWDNAKKYIEKGSLGADQGKGSAVVTTMSVLISQVHAAAVVGDTVGDPLKDTSGPSLNILMKLMAILSVVLAPFFKDSCKYSGFLERALPPRA